MAVSTLKRESLAEKATAAILSLIADGNLDTGDELPSTAELAQRFGVSRTVVREALAELAGRGIISRSQGRESVVTAPGAREIRQVLNFHVGSEQVGIDSLLEFRRGLEGESVVLAAQRADADDLARMRATIEKQASSPTQEEFQATDYEFHREIALASRNPLFILVLDAVGLLLEEGQKLSYAGRTGRGHTLDEAVSEHWRIFEAIERHSATDASAAMTAHLDQTADDIRASQASSRME